VDLHGEFFQASRRSVTGNCYSVLGSTPLLGGLITTEDQENSPVAVISYEFWQRRFGGAPDAIWLVMREALALVLLGVAVGIPSALAVSRLIVSMLFGISPGDLPTVAAVSLLLLAWALFAAYIPARRASRTDPLVALRAE